MLAFVILGITLDWFFAPGTHDSQGVALIFLMTAAGSVFMFTLGLITVKKMRENARKTFIYPILICFLLLIVPFAWLTFLKSHHNEHLGKTNKTLWEYFS